MCRDHIYQKTKKNEAKKEKKSIEGHIPDITTSIVNKETVIDTRRDNGEKKKDHRHQTDID